ncbi:hypothetical protein pdam_00025115 [Pocillopora damicornis]|uniref:Uncharacterized protein n=1 Tax=Pocillopora damicornis TaxID=46731 RepID=A0A3M6U848_POCDA|nr:hypothetical protein pdam_00025115 [Pocillopora damicornis]
MTERYKTLQRKAIHGKAHEGRTGYASYQSSLRRWINPGVFRVMEASELECCLTVENLNSNGIVMKRRTFKSITVVLDRDEFREFAQSKQNGISSN